MPEHSQAAAAGRYRPSRSFVVTLLAIYTVGGLVLLPPSVPVHGRDAGPTLSIFSRASYHPTATVVDSSALERAALERWAHGPLARVLGRRSSEPDHALRIARALVRESRRLDVPPSLLAAVLITENPQLDADVVSSQGAIGLMQVMPFHAGEFACESDDLFDVESNICHGAGVFGQYLRRSKSLERALLRYNGCVNSTNTPRCHRYPSLVLRKAGQVRRMVLRYAEEELQ